MESDRCPTATFILTAPLARRSGVADGERVTAPATGDLTIHGVTNRVTIELEAELKGDSAVVVASAPVALADYDIEAIHRRCQGTSSPWRSEPAQDPTSLDGLERLAFDLAGGSDRLI